MVGIIERYIYAIVKRLPTGQRHDVEQELLSLIEDMLDEKFPEGNHSEEQVNDVILELGHPRKMAERYRGTKRYLIGPEIYDLFIIVSKISIISFVAVQAIILFIQVVMTPIEIIEIFVEGLVSIILTIPIIIGWIVVSFAFVQYFASDSFEKIQLDKDWSPASLPQIPDPKRQIKRRETIIGIIFYVLFIIGLAFNSEYFGIWIFQNDKLAHVIPFLNDQTNNTYFLLLIIVFVFGIVKECIKFMYEKWTYTLVAFTAIVNLISFVLIILIIAGDYFWNPNFVQELVQHQFVAEGTKAYENLNFFWEKITLWVMIFFAFGLIWDVVDGFIKVRKGK